MSLKTSVLGLLAFTVLGFAAQPAAAALIDYVGFGYETGGIDPSNPGDELTVLTVSTVTDPIFGADPGSEVTVYLSGLISTGSFMDPGTGWTIITYAGGSLQAYEDPSNDRDWGVNPPNGTAPASFANGSLMFEGAFTSFTMFLAPDGTGAFEGNLDGIGGSALATVCSNCAYSFAGVFTTNAQIPAGYDMQVDGTLDVDSAVPVLNSSSIGTLKSAFDSRP